MRERPPVHAHEIIDEALRDDQLFRDLQSNRAERRDPYACLLNKGMPDVRCVGRGD